MEFQKTSSGEPALVNGAYLEVGLEWSEIPSVVNFPRGTTCPDKVFRNCLVRVLETVTVSCNYWKNNTRRAMSGSSSYWRAPGR